MTRVHPDALLSGLPTSVVTDAIRALGVPAQWSRYVSRRAGEGAFAGRALTIRFDKGDAPQSVSMYDALFHEEARGAVLMVAAGGTDAWVTGANQCRVAELQGVNGMVVDGAVRDAATLAARGLGVLARGSSARPYGPALRIHEIGGTVRMAGMEVRSGDVVVGDDDGVVVFNIADIEAVVAQSRRIVGFETEIDELLRRGEPDREQIEMLNRQKKSTAPGLRITAKEL